MRRSASGVPITKRAAEHIAAADLLEARNIVIATLSPESHQRCNCRAEIAAGRWDKGQKVRAAFEGIVRGRDLERRHP